MVSYNQLVMLGIDAETFAYLEYEANRRHISIEDVYREEMASQQQFNQDPLTLDELKLLAASSRPDPRILENDEECPF